MANTSTTDVDLVGSEMTLNIARVALFAALMGAFAYVSFPNPLTPTVPVTLQVLGVFLAAIYLGPRVGRRCDGRLPAGGRPRRAGVLQ